ncbi:DUF805 domain-containing protein [Microbacterium protaetiae]|uniref:DUF805 domain-containing protein n=1 Tax=Microbacterium protaetiae TaxID=2509458 RepID=A0A4P6ETK4_9MICO|nr:DUF805 domain-containing protein [Microbacterium protaetiae]QAY61378.1 DUF805 domain-containing protein [Microbacterium protaetiae]
MSTDTPLPPAGWYPDPQGGTGERWWNGAAWSTETRAAAPNAQPAEPSAPVGYPGAQPGYGTTQQGYPGTQQTYPGTQQGYPGTQQGYPGTPQTNPNTQQGYPGTQQTYPNTQQGYPSYAQGAPVAAPIGIWRSPVDDRPVVSNPIDAVRTIFSKYARFEGRASRAEYWWWMLANLVIAVACYVIALVLIFTAAGATAGSGRSGFAALSVFGGLLMLALVLWELAVLVPGLAVLVRRLRDAGFHWGFIFLGVVPGGSIALLVMCCMPSKYP